MAYMKQRFMPDLKENLQKDALTHNPIVEIKLKDNSADEDDLEDDSADEDDL